MPRRENEMEGGGAGKIKQYNKSHQYEKCVEFGTDIVAYHIL